MKENVQKIKQLYVDFIQDAQLLADKGNKAAGRRARKLSLEFEKALKEFRKKSVNYTIE